MHVAPNTQNCHRCGETIPLGAPRFIVTFTLMADWDGTLPEMAQAEEVSSEAVADLLRAMENMSQEEIEAGVYERRIFILCSSCRNIIRQDPLGQRGDIEPAQGGSDGALH